MPNLTHRSTQLELLDADNIPEQDLFRNLYELDVINTWLGGHQVSISGLKKLKIPPQATIVDIGSGGGDNLRAMARWFSNRSLHVSLVGVDLKETCTQYARTHSAEYPEINLVTSDYRIIPSPYDKADVYHCALFCHHLTKDQLVELLKWMSTHAQVGFVINDLQRHPLAYHSIKLLTRLFSKSYLVKNDAPLSVWRGFSKREIKEACTQAGLTSVSIQWKWAFRWLIVWKRPK